MKFRETLWFKKGLLDAEVAQQPPTETGRIQIDTLPVEDRYVDDGSLQPLDSMAFGVHTGTTQALATLALGPASEAAVPESVLIAELKTGRRIVFAMLAFVMLAVAGAAMVSV